MGWSKYFEDNNEIICERLFMMGDCISEEWKSPKEIVSNITNLKHNTKRSQHKGENMYIICRDCGKKFLFSAQSQKYFKSKKLDIPKRCKSCRDFRNTQYFMCASF